jgi:hypothetical protein
MKGGGGGTFSKWDCGKSLIVDAEKKLMLKKFI